MNPYERHNLYKPYPKLLPFDIYPVATIVLAIGLAITCFILVIINL